MAFTIGITGGIGSGKTTVCGVFQTLGIPVFNSDIEAKRCYEDPAIRQTVAQKISPEVFEDGKLVPSKLAAIVFSDKDKLQTLNEIIHPAVALKFAEWRKAQKAPYVIKEAAILFESGAFGECHKTILVTCPEDIRVERVLSRDRTSEDQVRDRMSKQWSDDKKREMADFEIVNDGVEAVIPQVMRIHDKLVNLV